MRNYKKVPSHILENKTEVQYKKLIFKPIIRYILYISCIISSIITIGDYDVLLNPEQVKIQCISCIVSIVSILAIIFHTRLLDKYLYL